MKGNVRKYILNRGMFAEMLKDSSVLFFERLNFVKVDTISNTLYDEIYHDLVALAVNRFSGWVKVDWNIRNAVFTSFLEENRIYQIGIEFRDVCYKEDPLSLTLIRLSVYLQKQQEKEISDLRMRDIMDSYYNTVVDPIYLAISKEMRDVFGDDCWNIFDIVKRNFSSEVVAYDDFRHIAWDFLNLNKMVFKGKPV